MTSPQDPRDNPHQQYPHGESPQPGDQQPDPYAAPRVPPNEMAGPGEPPSTVLAAFWIAVIVPVVVTVLGVVMMLLSFGTAEQAVTATAPEFQRSAGNIVIISYVVVTIFYAVLTALWILFGFKMRAGRNWARVVLTIFAGLWILNALLGLTSGGMSVAGSSMSEVDIPTGMVVLGYAANGIALVTMIAFVVFAYVKPSNGYFQAAAHR